MSKNMLNWFLCGMTTGSALAALAASVAYGVIVYGGSVDVVPAFGTAVAVGALFWTLRRDGRRHPADPLISRERKARLPIASGHLSTPMPDRHRLRKSAY